MTITGTGFTGATAVHFGTALATNLTVVNATTITVDSPPGTGVVNVTVTTPLGTTATSAADQFTYGPTVTGLSPTSGPPGGGTLVTITGTGFTGASAVHFGTAAGTIVTVSATTITAYSPAGTGTVDVTVTTPNGTSGTLPADQFMYVTAPTVTGVAPTSGPAGGGTFVTITGTGFTGATEVDFGTAPATDLTVISATLITVENPAGSGTVDVTVVGPGGRSATSAADHFTYVAAPTISGVSPDFGPAAGGTSGHDHRDRLHRRHGGRLRYDAGDELHRRQRHHDHGRQPRRYRLGGCDRDGAGRDVGHHRRRITFTYAPTVSGISPTAGPLAGGTVVTITGTGFTGVTAVDFGTTPATTFTVVSPTSITADSPAGTGTVDVTVTAPSGTSADLVRRSLHLPGRADGFGLEPDRRSGGRRHFGDDHRDRLHRRHGGRLRHDAGDET